MLLASCTTTEQLTLLNVVLQICTTASVQMAQVSSSLLNYPLNSMPAQHGALAAALKHKTCSSDSPVA